MFGIASFFHKLTSYIISDQVFYLMTYSLTNRQYFRILDKNSLQECGVYAGFCQGFIIKTNLPDATSKTLRISSATQVETYVIAKALEGVWDC